MAAEFENFFTHQIVYYLLIKRHVHITARNYILKKWMPFFEGTPVANICLLLQNEKLVLSNAGPDGVVRILTRKDDILKYTFIGLNI